LCCLCFYSTDCRMVRSQLTLQGQLKKKNIRNTNQAMIVLFVAITQAHHTAKILPMGTTAATFASAAASETENVTVPCRDTFWPINRSSFRGSFSRLGLNGSSFSAEPTSGHHHKNADQKNGLHLDLLSLRVLVTFIWEVETIKIKLILQLCNFARKKTNWGPLRY
jgi:hypothetical protein